jgi:hypothetical protein
VRRRWSNLDSARHSHLQPARGQTKTAAATPPSLLARRNAPPDTAPRSGPCAHPTVAQACVSARAINEPRAAGAVARTEARYGHSAPRRIESARKSALVAHPRLIGISARGRATRIAASHPPRPRSASRSPPPAVRPLHISRARTRVPPLRRRTFRPALRRGAQRGFTSPRAITPETRPTHVPVAPPSLAHSAPHVPAACVASAPRRPPPTNLAPPSRRTDARRPTELIQPLTLPAASHRSGLSKENPGTRDQPYAHARSGRSVDPESSPRSIDSPASPAARLRRAAPSAAAPTWHSAQASRPCSCAGPDRSGKPRLCRGATRHSYSVNRRQRASLRPPLGPPPAPPPPAPRGPLSPAPRLPPAVPSKPRTLDRQVSLAQTTAPSLRQPAPRADFLRRPTDSTMQPPMAPSEHPRRVEHGIHDRT